MKKLFYLWALLVFLGITWIIIFRTDSSKQVDLPEQTDSQHSTLNRKLCAVRSYLINSCSSNEKGADVVYSLSRKTWSNPNDTRTLSDSVRNMIASSVPLNHYSVRFIERYADIVIASISVVGTTITYSYSYDNARSETRDRKRTEWRDVNQLTIRDKVISKRMFADDVFDILNSYGVERYKDPKVINISGDNEMIVTQHYRFHGQYVHLTFQRVVGHYFQRYTLTAIRIRSI